MEWQPIETAPKDDALLVCGTRQGWEHCGPHIVCARRDSWTGRWSIYGAAPSRHSPQWLDTIDPTHWMPLPAPPAEKGEDK